MILNSPYISGSLTVTGNTTIQGQLTVTGSLSGTASLASNSLLLQGTGSTGFATTASFLQVSSSQQQISSSLLQVSASYTALSGSYNVFSGSASTRITVDSASLLQVSSSQQQISASYIALSGSYNTFSGSASTRVTQIENVYATTGSNSFRANQSITGSLVVSSTITAQTLVVQTVTSSIVYSSGSNIFGSQLSDRQTFTGSLQVTGSNHNIFGNVGIGATTFTAGNGTNLEVANSSVARVLVTQTGTRSFSLSAESNAFYLYDQTANATRLYVSASGYVGIGTTSPTRQLFVNDTVFFDNAGNGSTTNPSIAIGSTSLGISYLAGSNMALLTGGSTKMYISASGNVGIGTCAPTMPLTFADALGGKILLNANSNNYSIGLAAGVVSADASMKFTAGCITPGDFTFYRGSTLSMIITCAGNVGIGSGAPDRTFYLNGDSSLLGNNYISTSKFFQWEGGAYWTMRVTSTGNQFEIYRGDTGASPFKITSANLVQVSNATQTDDSGLIQIYNTATAATDNASLTVKSYNGTGQFMQWENLGMRIGSRIKTNTGAGGIYFTYGNDAVGMTITACGTIKTQTSQALGALNTSGTIANNNCVSLNLNGGGGNASIGFIAIGAARTDTTACQAVRLYSHSHTNGFNTYTSIQGTNDGGITISDCVASGAQYIYNCSGATVNYVVRYINLISLNSIFERE